MTTTRVSLEPPERTEPIRSWRGARRAGEPAVDNGAKGEAASDSEAADGDDSWSNVVTRGVQMGYEVVEEHIRQGERVARQINTRNYTPRAMGNDIWEFAERSARFSMDMVAVWWSLLTALQGGLPFANNPFIPQPPDSGRPPDDPRHRDDGRRERRDAPDGDAENPVLAVSVQSPQAVEVEVDLQPGAARRPLATRGLQALSGNGPDLTDIAFVVASASRRASVKIRVPKTQPPGTYAGVVFEKDTSRARGTLTIRVGT